MTESSTHEVRPISDSDVLIDHESRITALETKATHTSQRFTGTEQSFMSINGHLSSQDTQLAVLLTKMDQLWSIKKIIFTAMATTASGSILIWVANNIQRIKWPW